MSSLCASEAWFWQITDHAFRPWYQARWNSHDFISAWVAVTKCAHSLPRAHNYSTHSKWWGKNKLLHKSCFQISSSSYSSPPPSYTTHPLLPLQSEFKASLVGLLCSKFKSQVDTNFASKYELLYLWTESNAKHHPIHTHTHMCVNTSWTMAA